MHPCSNFSSLDSQSEATECSPHSSSQPHLDCDDAGLIGVFIGVPKVMLDPATAELDQSAGARAERRERFDRKEMAEVGMLAFPVGLVDVD